MADNLLCFLAFSSSGNRFPAFYLLLSRPPLCRVTDSTACERHMCGRGDRTQLGTPILSYLPTENTRGYLLFKNLSFKKKFLEI